MLAEYVVALLKHEKSSADLKELCLSQLVDFLGDHTTRFVDDLFDAVASKSYLVQRGTIATQPLPAASATADSASGANASATEGGGGRRRGGFDSDAEDDDDDRNFKHRRSGQDTHMDIVDDRGGEPSGGKAIETYEGGHPNGGGGGGGFQKRRRDDGWEDRDGRPGKMMRGPPRGGFGGPMAPPPRFDGRWGGPPGPMMMPPPPGAFDMNAPFFRGGPPGFRGGRGGFRGGPGGNAPFGGPPVERRRGRCFDYDRKFLCFWFFEFDAGGCVLTLANSSEKGYCLRGDMCPYDHGDDRIVVESGGVGGAEVFTPRDRRELSRIVAVGYHRLAYRTLPLTGPDVMTLNPEGADQDMMDTSNDRGTRPSGRGRGGFASNRGSTIGRPAIAKGQPRSDNTLVVEKIPDEFCSIEKINEFFKKFGTIVNIQVDPRNSKATIQFSKPYEARQAYNSPEVVFGNRFVKVYYLALEQGQQGPGTLGGSAAMDISPSASPKLPAEPPKPTLTPEEQAEREAKLKEIREQEEKVKKEQLHAKIMLAKLQAKEAMQAKAAEDAAKKTTAEEQKKLELDKDLEMHAAGEQGQLKNMLESKVAELQAEVSLWIPNPSLFIGH